MSVKLKEKPKVSKETEEVEEVEQDPEEKIGGTAKADLDQEEQEDQGSEELAQLREENRKMAERLERLETAPKPSGNTITAAQLEAMNEAEREQVEKTAGIPFEDVVRRVRANEQAAWEADRIREKARQNVRDAIDDEVDRNPKAAKLKGHIKDYLADISDNDKADPVRLARHMKKALTYAKGAAGVPDVTPSTTRNTRTARPEEDGDGEVIDNDPKSGKIKEGTYRFSDEFKIRIENLVAPEKRKKMVHPEHPTGVRMSSDFDEAPRFR